METNQLGERTVIILAHRRTVVHLGNKKQPRVLRALFHIRALHTLFHKRVRALPAMALLYPCATGWYAAVDHSDV